MAMQINGWCKSYAISERLRIKEALIILRKQNDVSLKELAALTGFSRVELSKFEASNSSDIRIISEYIRVLEEYVESAKKSEVCLEHALGIYATHNVANTPIAYRMGLLAMILYGQTLHVSSHKKAEYWALKMGKDKTFFVLEEHYSIEEMREIMVMLKYLRIHYRVSPERMAEKLGISKQELFSYEQEEKQGKYEIGILKQYAEVMQKAILGEDKTKITLFDAILKLLQNDNPASSMQKKYYKLLRILYDGE